MKSHRTKETENGNLVQRMAGAVRRVRVSWAVAGAALLIVALGLVSSQAIATTMTVIAEPLQNPTADGSIKELADWSGASGSSSPSFTSVSDTYVSEAKATTNYGTASSIELKALTNKAIRGLAQFDVSSIPGGATVTSATFKLCATAVPGSTRTQDVYLVTSSWVETSVTWGTQPTVAASATASATTPASAGCMTWTVTSDVQLWVDGTANNGFLVREQDETGTGGGIKTSFRSREDTAVPADVPTLDVTYTAPFTMRHESSDLTINGSDEVTTVDVQGTKDADGGTKTITVDLKDTAGTVVATGTGTLTAGTTYNVSIAMSPATITYKTVAEVKVVYTN